MCTLTWTADSERFTILFNRDEARTRSIARPPQRRLEQGMRYLAPHDPDGGGTWIAVNQRGICIALLNHYAGDVDHRPLAPHARSRGLVVTDLSACHSIAAVGRTLRDYPLARCRPFRLAAFTPASAPVIWQWDGLRLQRINPTRPLMTTSSLEPTIVPSLRERWFDRICGPCDTRRGPDRDDLLAFHRGAAPLPAGANVAMDRPEACTVSLTIVDISAEAIRMEYLDGHPTDTVGQQPWTANLPPPRAETPPPRDRAAIALPSSALSPTRASA